MKLLWQHSTTKRCLNGFLLFINQNCLVLLGQGRGKKGLEVLPFFETSKAIVFRQQSTHVASRHVLVPFGQCGCSKESSQKISKLPTHFILKLNEIT